MISVCLLFTTSAFIYLQDQLGHHADKTSTGLNDPGERPENRRLFLWSAMAWSVTGCHFFWSKAFVQQTKDY
jgi:ABC-type Fe3+ transport system permease subunit